MTATPTFRFAPSPNGLLHRGHAYSALLNARLAERCGGRLLLRIEDIDSERTREDYVRQIVDDLSWLGLRWPKPVLRQSDPARIDAYRQALQRLQELGVVYLCFASRREIQDHPATPQLPANPDGAPLYPGIWRDRPERERQPRIAAGEPYNYRLDMGKALALARAQTGNIAFTSWQGDGRSERIVVDPSLWGDVVIARKFVPGSYTLSVVVDDAFQQVTHVVRGMDLYHATSLQRLLQVLLDLPEPVYHHHPLVLDATGRKLSKSAGDESLKALRERGLTRQQLLLQLPPFPVE